MKQLKILVFIAILGSCTYYSFFKINKNIVGTWYLERFYIDGKDLTSSLKVTNYTEVYSEDGQLTISYKLNDDSTYVTTGNYSSTIATDENLSFTFSNIELDGFDGETSVIVPDSINVEYIKKENNLHYSYYYNGAYYKFKLVWALNQ